MVGACIAAMKITNSVHSPVGAYAVLLADAAAVKSLGWKYLLYPGLSGAIILLICQRILLQVRGSPSRKRGSDF